MALEDQFVLIDRSNRRQHQRHWVLTARRANAISDEVRPCSRCIDASERFGSGYSGGEQLLALISSATRREVT
jgi:hypothetical protein